MQEISPRPRKNDRQDVSEKTLNEFSAALADDLNTPRALAVIYDYIKQVNKDLDKKKISQPTAVTIWNTFLTIDLVFGIIKLLADKAKSEKIPKEITKILDEREQARKNGDFEKADQLRRKIESHGYRLNDSSDGPTTVEKL